MKFTIPRENELRQLLEGARTAVSDRRAVIVCFSWKFVPEVALLPFQLHLFWNRDLPRLSTTSTIGYAPCYNVDYTFFSLPIYEVDQVLSLRQKARIAAANSREVPQVLTLPDWEQGCCRHYSAVSELTLGGRSFVAIDEIREDGQRTRGGRPALGKLSVRRAERPSLLVPSRRSLTNEAVQQLADVDFLIVNLQRQRGQTLQSLKELIRRRGKDRPTLLIASSPSDLLAADIKEILPDTKIQLLGDVHRSSNVSVTALDNDRMIAEKSYRFSIGGLQSDGVVPRYVIEQAAKAWWVARQAMDAGGTYSDIERFSRQVDRLRQTDITAYEFAKHSLALIENSWNDSSLAERRLGAVVDTVMNAHFDTGVRVIARFDDHRAVKAALAEALETEIYELNSLNVILRSPLQWPINTETDACVLTGYFGHESLDVLLSTSAKHISLVFDFVEARVAYFHARKLAAFLDESGIGGAVPLLEQICGALEAAIPPHARTLDFDDESLASIFRSASAPAGQAHAAVPADLENSDSGFAVVSFTDGNIIEVSKNSRFDLLPGMGRRIATVAASELEPGDDVILLDGESRALFSERLFETLDQSVLKSVATQRSLWLTLVSAVRVHKGIRIGDIVAKMAAQGRSVEYSTTRMWINFESADAASIPETEENFIALAQALGLALTVEQLHELFSGIRRWRVSRRLAGRRLSRAIRAAYTNRFDAVAKERLKRDWGLDVLELVTGAYVATVENVRIKE